jgi:antitoxin (DNA-binding transcriptional repressor) of toxin-antitoxin stability system
MKTATVRQVRHAFPKVLRWIQDGETVDVTMRGRVVVQMRPPPAAKKPGKVEWPDFEARARAYSGGVTLTAEQAAQIIAESRGEK